MHQLRAGFPIFAHRRLQPIKNPGHHKVPGLFARTLFSGMFNVARNPVTKRHACQIRAFIGGVNYGPTVIRMLHVRQADVAGQRYILWAAPSRATK
jgi:hypothetical protein